MKGGGTLIIKKDIKGIIMGVLIILLIGLIISFIYFKNNNKVNIYKIYGESENFYYSDALFVSSNIKNIYVYGNVQSKTNKVSIDDITKFTFMSGNRLIVSSNSMPRQISVENYGYDELFPKEVVDNLDNWYLEITYKVDKEEFTEKIKLQNDYLMNKVKVQPIG